MNRHRPSDAQPGREHTTSKAAPIAANACRAASKTGAATTSAPSSIASAQNATASCLARAPKRRTRPAPSCAGRPGAEQPAALPPAPTTTCSTTSPTASATSRRPTNTNAGTTASVRLHRPRRTRGTKIDRLSPSARTKRRYPDQRVVAPAQPGQSGRGTSSPRPAAAYSSTDNGHGHTIATGGNTALDPLPLQRPTDGEGVPVQEPPILTPAALDHSEPAAAQTT